MARERVQKQIVPKGLQDHERALYERIVMRQILIVPNALSLQGRRAHDDADNYEEKNAQPFSAEISRQFRQAGNWSPIANYARARNCVPDSRFNERGW